MGEDSGEKTEEPTPHKLREARKKGAVAKSKEITGAILLLVAFYTFKATASSIWGKMLNITFLSFRQIPLDFNSAIVGGLLREAVMSSVVAILPILCANFITALIIEGLQTGFLVTLAPVTPNLSKLNPIDGMKKFVHMKQYVELAKSLVKMFLVVWLLYDALRDEFYMVLISQQLTLWQIMAFTGRIVMKVITRLSLLYFFIALLDYFYQRYEYIKSNKMSKKEIKDEYKRLEGDPMIKQRQRDAARQMSMGRQMGSVPGADVVVTNPFHIAVALQYKHNQMDAPVVVAKGKRLVALQIRQVATHHKVPIIENPPLARGLFKSAEVFSRVPPRFYKPVAEILAFVYNLRKNREKYR